MGALLVWALGASAEVSAGECQLLLSEAQMNYGRLLRSQMKRVNGPTGALYEVGKRTLNVTAVCPADTIMSLTFNGMGIDDQRFGFALNGFITFRVLDAQLDGRS
ncbi:hypothetical protein, partial [Mesorhizobium japonicum]|uniref:hypothetical protein n=1 Tax=Mesorhizobium japonicum TaxID=2066070 RepID=UPI003B5BBDF2